MAQGRIRRLVTRRRAKWAGVVVCILLAVVFVSSRWWFALANVRGQRVFGQRVLWNLTVGHGRVRASLSDLPFAPGVKPHYTFLNGWDDDPALYLWLNWDFQSVTFSGSSFKMRTFDLPLWMPLLVLAVPTVWLWRTDRRAKPWQCAKCRYDLRGLEDGVCPECGESRQFSP